jgi:aspartyl-tRNA(Asn)/glutamyl-tRNA(Gln) amidotransferase subunit C
MKITLEEIKKTARLAKFDITDEEAKLYSEQLSAVLNWVQELQNVDTSAAEGDFTGFPAPLREDTPVLNPARQAIVEAFNDGERDLLKVKKVL